MIKVIFGVVSFLVGLSAIIDQKLFRPVPFTWMTRSGGEVEMEMANNDLRRNAEGYSDPTAYEAIKNLDADDERFHKLLNTIFTICELSGFHLEERIVLKDLQTGKVWR